VNWRAKRAWIEVLATALAATATPFGSHAALIVVGEVGNARASSTNLDPYFDLLPDVSIFDSTTIAHASAVSDNNAFDDVDWYSFTGVAGATIFLDLDCGSTCGVSFDPTLALFDGTGTLVAYSDDNDLDVGTLNTQDPFVGVFILPSSGTYYAAVSNYDRLPDAIASCTSSSYLTRPDGFFGGIATDGCTPGDDSFSGGFWPQGDYILHVSNSLPVPEPSALALVALGLAGLGVRLRTRRLA
jgi:hypothetical protein